MFWPDTWLRRWTEPWAVIGTKLVKPSRGIERSRSQHFHYHDHHCHHHLHCLPHRDMCRWKSSRWSTATVTDSGFGRWTRSVRSIIQILENLVYDDRLLWLIIFLTIRKRFTIFTLYNLFFPGKSDPKEMSGDDILIKDPWGESDFSAFIILLSVRNPLKCNWYTFEKGVSPNIVVGAGEWCCRKYVGADIGIVSTKNFPCLIFSTLFLHYRTFKLKTN